MPSPTRRDALHVAAALLAGVAGCSGDPPSPSTPYAEESTGTIAFDPQSHRLRNPERTPIVWTGERPTQTDGVRRHRLHSHFFLTDASEVSEVGFADVSGADAARDFLDATDYGSETVYVEQSLVGECFTHTLCHVEWSESDIETSYTREYRDADVACETEAYDTVATLIRIPEAFDPSEINGYGSSRGSAPCSVRNEHLRRRRNESERQ